MFASFIFCPSDITKFTSSQSLIYSFASKIPRKAISKLISFHSTAYKWKTSWLCFNLPAETWFSESTCSWALHIISRLEVNKKEFSSAIISLRSSFDFGFSVTQGCSRKRICWFLRLTSTLLPESSPFSQRRKARTEGQNLASWIKKGIG